MSEFHVIEINFQDADCIVKALQEMGYSPQINLDTPMHLRGYQGDVRAQKAHIVIPKSQVGNASNDVGFEKVNGECILHLSQYDIHAKTFKVDEFKKLYSKHKIESFLKKNSKKFKKKFMKVDEKGKIHIRMKVRG